MTIKARLYAYLVFIHALLGAVLIWQREPLGWWLFLFELLLVVSLVTGMRWVRRAQLPHDIAVSLPEVIESGEFGARYPEIGQKDIDRVIGTYNRMLENLQRERMQLGEQRGFLERFLSVTQIGIVIFDFDGRVSVVNPRARALLGCGNEDLTGKPIAAAGGALAGTLANFARGECRLITDSAGRRLRCQRSSFSDRGFARDYMLIEELTIELNRSERATYEKLIRMMSHEVMNTVAATNSMLESSRNYAPEFRNGEHREDYLHALDVLITRNRNLNEFTQAFSDLVKLPEPHLRPQALDDLLDSMRTIFSAQLSERNIDLVVAVDDDVPAIECDRNQIEQVVINIIKNAAEAIERDGRIEVAARRSNGVVELSISDDGIGLSEDAEHYLFTPFYTTKKQGQGLGLTFVREILNQHGFGFSLATVDDRTRFRIEIPQTHH